MEQSTVFDSEVSRYLRTLADRTYQFLMRSTDRYLELGRMERTRKAQIFGQERDRSTRVGAVAGVAERD